MNPDDRLGEAVKQGRIAAESDLADDYAERIIENAVENLERAQRRLKRHRLERERRQEVTVDAE